MQQLKTIESEYHRARLRILLEALKGSVERTLGMLKDVRSDVEKTD